jgi:hypothetical protein
MKDEIAGIVAAVAVEADLFVFREDVVEEKGVQIVVAALELEEGEEEGLVVLRSCSGYIEQRVDPLEVLVELQHLGDGDGVHALALEPGECALVFFDDVLVRLGGQRFDVLSRGVGTVSSSPGLRRKSWNSWEYQRWESWAISAQKLWNPSRRNSTKWSSFLPTLFFSGIFGMKQPGQCLRRTLRMRSN